MTESLVDYPIILPQKKATFDTTVPREQVTSTVCQTPASSHTFIRKVMGNRSPQEEVIAIICLSLRGTTTSRYEGVLRQQKNYCWQTVVDPLVTDVKNVLDFLHGIYKRGCRYSGCCAARSALSSAVTIPRSERMSNHLSYFDIQTVSIISIRHFQNMLAYGI